MGQNKKMANAMVRQGIVNAFVRGVRSGVAGEARPDENMGAFVEGFDIGRTMMTHFHATAEEYADKVMNSPAMVQAQANADAKALRVNRERGDS